MPSAEYDDSSSSDRFIVAHISEPAEWRRDYSSDTKDYIAWQSTSHILPMSEFKKLLKIPAVAAKLGKQKDKTTLTIEFPDMYIMSGDDDYLVAQVKIPNTKKPLIVCTWPSQPRNKEEEELETLRKKVADLEAEVEKLRTERDTATEERDHLKYDLDKANREIWRFNRLQLNPHLPEDQLEDELWEPKQEPL